MSAFGQNRPHIEVVRTTLIKNVSTLLPDVIDEVSAAFKDLVTAADKDWTSIEAFPSARKIICRATNRFFLGPAFFVRDIVVHLRPKCSTKADGNLARNAEYMDLIDKASTDILTTLGYRSYFPGPLKTFASQHLTDLPSDIKNISAQLRPLIEAELQREKDGSKGNNVIRWLLDEAKDGTPSVDDIVLRVLAINFVALETESDGLKQILFYLAAYPEYIQAMREEAESIIEAEGLTKDSLAKMHKVDSFIKETQRLTIMSLAVHRNVIKDFTFSNGLFLPKGIKVAIPTHAVQTDERNYTDALEFKPFRFAEMRQLDEQDGDNADSEKFRRGELASLSPTFLNFGIGRHACPGRFFAANMLKAVLVHMLLNYDVALPDFPDASTQETNLRIPDGLEHVRLRRRA
ncbi:LOW QUALITY PROTEIN: hypothetical protein CVT26_012615 [Gymnopilus dilepis]|uniref:Cytochrome P450 n=1 Tax=Gymnopilus dilepis TaxID=231916 RepID=A0A409YVX4_9AGAR|nr:LOW QUALITY PROTEIN: hypothetical protein CVT26_012615 [Gymnopilus dilepis]